MPVDNRPTVGNSVGGGLWKKPQIESESVSASQSVELDKVSLEAFKSIVYIISVWDDSADRIKTLNMSVGKKNGQVVDSVYGKTGDSLNIALSSNQVGDSIVITLTNNEAFNLNIDAARISIGRP